MNALQRNDMSTDAVLANDRAAMPFTRRLGGLKLVHACCWTHARRKFFEAHGLCPSESVAKGIVLLIDQLFAIDAQARAQNCDWAARDALRQQQARPLVKEAA